MLAAMNATQRASALEAEANLPALSQSQLESLILHAAGVAAVAALLVAFLTLAPHVRRRGIARGSCATEVEQSNESEAVTTSMYEPLPDGI